MTALIALFNHKGGVSKTYHHVNLGWALAVQGKRVLIVDADPQCNLTGTALGLNDEDELRRFTPAVRTAISSQGSEAVNLLLAKKYFRP